MSKGASTTIWIIGLLLTGAAGALITGFVMQRQLSSEREAVATQKTALQQKIDELATKKVLEPEELSDKEAITKYLTAKCHTDGSTAAPSLSITIEDNFASVGINCTNAPGYIQWMKKTEGIWYETFAGQNPPTQSTLDLWDFPRSEALGTSFPNPEPSY